MFIVVANWKSQLTLNQTLALCKQNAQAFDALSRRGEVEIVVCPSFMASHEVNTLFRESPVQVGAQNCSMYRKGAYTGEVLAESLSEAGCTYCIVGHSERRSYFKETDLDIAVKVGRLFEVGIEPIICIGDTKQEYDDKRTLAALAHQLEPVFERITNNHKDASGQKICIAYEPVWSIGTGMIPQRHHLQEVFAWISQLCAEKLPQVSCRLLYGGSVDVFNTAKLRAEPLIGGVLVGSASIDFQNFEKIVSSCC